MKNSTPLLALGASLLLAVGCAGGNDPSPNPGGTNNGTNNGVNNGTNNGANNGANNGGGSCIDRDRDGYGRGAGCRGADCDDTDPNVFDECSPECVDNDRDGYGEGAACRGPDCDDNDPDVNPGVREVPGNGKDDDCRQGDLDCIDEDGDGFGEGGDCRGPDCDDTNRDVSPRSREVCGDGIDNDCMDGDMECPTDCVDEDGDGFGEGDGCMGPDCDDMDPAANPDGEESCNGKDDNCDGEVDECEGDGLACDPNRRQCFGALDSDCERTPDCITGLICDSGKCLGGPEVACDDNDDCARSFICDNDEGHCVADPNYDICTEELMCEENDQICLRDQARCVDCVDHLDCPGLEFCAGFSCLEMPYNEFMDEADDRAEMGQWFANCILGTGNDDIEICGIIDAIGLEDDLDKDAVVDWLCDDATEADFQDGERDLEAAQGVAGCGLFNDQDLNWDEDIPAGDLWTYCMWSLPAAFFLDEKNVVVAPCTEFPVE